MSTDQAHASQVPASSIHNPATRAINALVESLDQVSPAVGENVLQLLAREGGKLELLIPAHQIVFGQLANRHRDAFRGEAFEELMAQIEATGGNEVAVVVRPVCGPDAHERLNRDEYFEVVAGHRRLKACQALGLKVKAVVYPEMSDHEAARLMHSENLARKSLSPYETGAMYQNLLDQKLYPSQNALAKGLKVASSEVSRALALVRIPEDLIAALPSPLDLQAKDAEFLRALLEQSREAVLEKAAELAALKRKLSRPKVFEALEAAAQAQGGVGSANTPGKQAAQAPQPANQGTAPSSAQSVYSVAWDDKGRARIRIAQSLDDAERQKLEQLLERFFAKGRRGVSDHGASRSR